MTNQDRIAKIALYARVSTSEAEDKQDPEVQLSRLRDFAQAHSYVISKEYIDRKSGSDPNRPQLEEMMKGVKMRDFQAIIIVRLDRITRSLVNLLSLLQILEENDVKLICLDQPIDTSSASGRLIVHVIAAVAEFERELIRDRVKDGIRKATQGGKSWGRRLTPIDLGKVTELRARGCSYRKISEQLGIPEATIRRRVKNKGVVSLNTNGGQNP